MRDIYIHHRAAALNIMKMSLFVHEKSKINTYPGDLHLGRRKAVGHVYKYLRLGSIIILNWKIWVKGLINFYMLHSHYQVP